MKIQMKTIFYLLISAIFSSMVCAADGNKPQKFFCYQVVEAIATLLHVLQLPACSSLLMK